VQTFQVNKIPPSSNLTVIGWSVT